MDDWVFNDTARLVTGVSATAECPNRRQVCWIYQEGQTSLCRHNMCIDSAEMIFFKKLANRWMCKSYDVLVTVQYQEIITYREQTVCVEVTLGGDPSDIAVASSSGENGRYEHMAHISALFASTGLLPRWDRICPYISV